MRDRVCPAHLACWVASARLSSVSRQGSRLASVILAASDTGAPVPQVLTACRIIPGAWPATHVPSARSFMLRKPWERPRSTALAGCRFARPVLMEYGRRRSFVVPAVLWSSTVVILLLLLFPLALLENVGSLESQSALLVAGWMIPSAEGALGFALMFLER